MKSRRTAPATVALALASAVATTALPAPAAAQSLADGWKFRAIAYGYFPDIGGSSTFPAPTGGGSTQVDASKILDNLQSAFMGTFEAHKGRFGFLVDVLYMDVHGAKTNTRDVSIDGHELPIGVMANTDLALRGTVLELAASYAAVTDPRASLDVVGGARMLDIRQTLTLELSAAVGPDTGPGRSRETTVHPTYWDAIVGARGQFRFGDRQEWFVPWYADVGAGESRLTYQLIGGLGYAFSWGQLIGAWRYLDYDFKSGSALQSMDFSGPMLGVAFAW
ncbi:MAG: hypothetical protein IT516_16855 [Burkholderiales bacterium]|nr:hypothetical protein [Burkholderiales bacterium]